MAKGVGVAIGSRGLGGFPPSLEATYFRPQPLTLYLIDTMAKGVGVAKGVQRLGRLRSPSA
uniref:Uncharacterized protein n=1 Tax=Oryza meridionalis TaxID=40149 RepID=A0A0E0ELB5_9ORYZ